MSVCERNIYERANLRVIEAFVKPDTVYFDIGANIGLTSVPVLCDFPSCKVVSFEPSPNALPYLSKTHAGSPYRDRWQIIGKAVGREMGTVNFYTYSAEGSPCDGLQDTGRKNLQQVIPVPMTTLDHEWKSIGSSPVSFIKMDVEGAELNVLRGGQECVQNQRPVILTEWNAVNLKAHSCPPESLLAWAKGSSYSVRNAENGVHVNEANSLKLQMLLTENFLLVPKE